MDEGQMDFIFHDLQIYPEIKEGILSEVLVTRAAQAGRLEPGDCRIKYWR